MCDSKKQSHPQLTPEISGQILIQPNLIENMDLNPKQVDLKKNNKLESKEYINDIKNLMIKTNIVNLLAILEDCDDSIESKKIMQMIKNTLILHDTNIKTMPNLIKYIQNALLSVSSHQNYDVCVICKILDNIQNGNLIDNIHFRYIEEYANKYPPIPAHDRIALERKIKCMTQSHQVHKKHTPFNVGQIVGAKDKENKWWLSRILHVFDDPAKFGYWYYVRFEGWGSMHDEWIYSETYRVRYYNSRKHFLKK